MARFGNTLSAFLQCTMLEGPVQISVEVRFHSSALFVVTVNRTCLSANDFNRSTLHLQVPLSYKLASFKLYLLRQSSLQLRCIFCIGGRRDQLTLRRLSRSNGQTVRTYTSFQRTMARNPVRPQTQTLSITHIREERFSVRRLSSTSRRGALAIRRWKDQSRPPLPTGSS
jgi:hypothetical protein